MATLVITENPMSLTSALIASTPLTSDIGTDSSLPSTEKSLSAKMLMDTTTTFKLLLALTSKDIFPYPLLDTRSIGKELNNLAEKPMSRLPLSAITADLHTTLLFILINSSDILY